MYFHSVCLHMFQRVFAQMGSGFIWNKGVLITHSMTFGLILNFLRLALLWLDTTWGTQPKQSASNWHFAWTTYINPQGKTNINWIQHPMQNKPFVCLLEQHTKIWNVRNIVFYRDDIGVTKPIHSSWVSGCPNLKNQHCVFCRMQTFSIFALCWGCCGSAPSFFFANWFGTNTRFWPCSRQWRMGLTWRPTWGAQGWLIPVDPSTTSSKTNCAGWFWCRKRVEIMADHIARLGEGNVRNCPRNSEKKSITHVDSRNGAEFEATVKQKNANNPQCDTLDI